MSNDVYNISITTIATTSSMIYTNITVIISMTCFYICILLVCSRKVHNIILYVYYLVYVILRIIISIYYLVSYHSPLNDS